jgi:Taurine catabolism dioxygenase TauD, TfdA family
VRRATRTQRRDLVVTVLLGAPGSTVDFQQRCGHEGVPIEGRQLLCSHSPEGAVVDRNERRRESLRAEQLGRIRHHSLPRTIIGERIVELGPDESAVLLSSLEDVATDPNRSLRWRWSEGDVAIWDEARTMHCALVDHHPSMRRMRRCTVNGDRPVPVSAGA